MSKLTMKVLAEQNATLNAKIEGLVNALSSMTGKELAQPKKQEVVTIATKKQVLEPEESAWHTLGNGAKIQSSKFGALSVHTDGYNRNKSQFIPLQTMVVIAENWETIVVPILKECHKVAEIRDPMVKQHVDSIMSQL